MANVYADLLCSLAAADVRFVVAGGVAVVLQGVERMTVDIDVALDMDPANVRKFVDVMQAQGLQPRVPVPADFIADPENVRRMVEEKNALVFTYIDPANPLKHIDVFLTQDASYARLVGDADSVPLRGHTIRVASKPTLIAMKQAVEPQRAKDAHDIAELRRLIAEGDDG